ncbi:MAG TPA: peptide chain release factor N(5)-glutamine methyltransferase [Solirubrobacteraceae bacterium]|nr:peptide chain release factor N(5)-glutamine methyltransferase [Solirubrobacteraceae bacterium]
MTEAAVAAESVNQALARGAATLAAAGVDAPRLDSELLLAEAMAVGRERLVLEARAGLPAETVRRYDRLLTRRVAREPVAYILGRREFRRLTLSVDRRALIPRPETELLVELGLTLAPAARVADVGTGSGAVALALKDERPDLTVVGIDVSEDALAIARKNGAQLGLDVRFVCADLLDGGDYDAVLANLPYVADGAAVAPEISLYEPASALFAGADGLDAIRRLVRAARSVPVLALEVGFDQADAVSQLLADGGFGSVARMRDLAGIERVIVGRR